MFVKLRFFSSGYGEGEIGLGLGVGVELLSGGNNQEV